MIKMNTVGESGLLCTGLWIVWRMYLVWKHRNCATVCFCISSSLKFHVLCYQNMRVFIPKTSCQAARPRLIIQQYRHCHFMFESILTSSILHLILWQNKERASFLLPKSIKALMAMSRCLWWQHDTIQKVKDSVKKTQINNASNVRTGDGVRQTWHAFNRICFFEGQHVSSM